MHSKKNNYLSVTILAILVGLAAIFVFHGYFEGYYFMSPGLCSDLVRANLPTYYLLFDSIAEGGNFWSWKMGIGTSMFSHADVVCDPFTYVVFLLGRNGIPSMMLWSLIVKIFAEALCFYGYLSSFNIDKKARIAAALVYSFCGYSIIIGLNFALGTILVYAPLVLWGVELLIKKKDAKLLLVSLFAVCIYSYYYFYSIGLLSACYLIIRSIQENKKWLGNLFRLAGMGIVTILLSAFILFPQLELVINSPRTNEGADVNFGLDLLVPDIATFSTAAVRAINNDVLGDGIRTSYLGSNYRITNADYFQTSTYCSILLIILLWYYIRHAKDRKKVILWFGVLAVCLLIPGFSFAMNMFSTVNTRWMYAISIAECVLIGVALDFLLKEKVLHIQTLFEGAVITGMLYLCGSAICLFVAGRNLYGLENFKSVYIAYILKNRAFILHAVMTIGIFLLVSIVYSKSKQNNSCALANICCICMAGLFVWDITFNYQTWLGIKESEKQYNVVQNAPYDDASAAIISTLRETDLGLYRIHKNFDSVYDFNGIAAENDSMAQNYYGITCYNSLNNAQYINFLQTLGIYVCLPQSRDAFVAEGITPEMVTGAQLNYIHGVEDDENLFDYLGVKYLLTKDGSGSLDNHWKQLFQTDDIIVYENSNAFPTAFINEKSMTMQEFLTLEYGERREAILENTIIDAEFTAESGTEGECREENIRILDFTQDRIEMSADNPYATNKILSFSIPYDRNWNIYVDGTRVEAKKVNISLLGVEITPGDHTVVLQYVPYAFILGCALSLFTLVSGAALYSFKKRKVRRSSIVNEKVV